MNAMTDTPALDAARCLDAVHRRDRGQDGRFVYAVLTTGVFCRPSCPSRQPKPENVRFYAGPAAARAAGFRPCKRCRPEETVPLDPRLAAIEKVAAAIREHVAAGAEGPPLLADLARTAGISAGRLQRQFTEAVGISPRAYAEAERVARLKKALRAGHGVADAVFDAGYGSGSRVYEKSDQRLGMTPATYARGGTGVDLTYATASCTLGRVLVAASARGIAAVELGDDDAALLERLEREFPRAMMTRDGAAMADTLDQVVRYLDARGPRPDLPLDIRASAFRERVWRALLAIPAGETRSYAEIARAIGAPGAARAVGTACGANRLAVLVPCHRVLREDGSLGGYRWGLARKEMLLAREAKD